MGQPGSKTCYTNSELERIISRERCTGCIINEQGRCTSVLTTEGRRDLSKPEKLPPAIAASAPLYLAGTGGASGTVPEAPEAPPMDIPAAPPLTSPVPQTARQVANKLDNKKLPLQIVDPATDKVVAVAVPNKQSGSLGEKLVPVKPSAPMKDTPTVLASGDFLEQLKTAKLKPASPRASQRPPVAAGGDLMDVLRRRLAQRRERIEP